MQENNLNQHIDKNIVNTTQKVVPPTMLIKDKIFNSLEHTSLLVENARYQNCRFINMKLTKIQMKTLYFERCQFNQIELNHCELDKCHFIQCELTGVTFNQTTCFDGYYHNSTLIAWHIENTLQERALFYQCHWQDVSILNSQMAFFNIVEVKVNGFRAQNSLQQDWNGYQNHFHTAEWQNVQCVRNVVGHSHYEKCVFRDIQGGGQIWFNSQFVECNLSNLSLPGGSFHRSQLKHCQLNASNFRAALFIESQLSDCDLHGAILQAIQAQDATFIRCNLNETQFQKAHLQRATFDACSTDQWCCSGADLRGASLQSLSKETSLAGGRLHAAHLPEQTQPLLTEEPLLTAIDRWYTRFQPGHSTTLPFPIQPSGSCRYV